MKIYLVSMKKDEKRREILKQNFCKTYDNFELIEAVDGGNLDAKSYFKYASSYFKKHNMMMSPSEVGCSLSHILTLETFLKSSDEYALILEDDVIGNDENIKEIEQILPYMIENSILLCAKQYSRKSRHKLVKIINNKIFEVSKFSHKYFLNTYAYVVNKQSANAILKNYKNFFTIADKWDELLMDDVVMLYSQIFKHPQVSDGYSNIEDERLALKLKYRIFSLDKFFTKNLENIYNILMHLYLRLKGYKEYKD